ncbi:unnamed protein product [Auanema sp. JU1783]|nr:unnamed protein product [Auanema sp. JU1783]
MSAASSFSETTTTTNNEIELVQEHITVENHVFQSEIELLNENKLYNKDVFNLVYIALVIESAAIFLAWNLLNFLSPTYYFNFWFSSHYIPSDYATKFMDSLGMDACSPLFALSILCILPFINNYLVRLCGSLFVNIINLMILFVISWVRQPSHFEMNWFYNITFTVMLIMMGCNGVFQSSLLGIASDLPRKYTSAVVIGTNVGGMISSFLYIFTTSANPKTPKPTAEVYYGFASIYLIICLNILIFLWRSDFVRLHVKTANNIRNEKKLTVGYFLAELGKVFKDAWSELLGIFILFFMMYTIFPTLSIGIQPWPSPGIAHLKKYFIPIGTFLNFYTFATAGAIAACFIEIKPSNRIMRLALLGPCVLSLLLIPYFMYCNFIPNYPEVRKAKVLFKNEWFYFIANGFMGAFIGLFSGILLPLLPRCVEPAVSRLASQVGAATMITGLYFGAGMSAAFISALE